MRVKKLGKTYRVLFDSKDDWWGDRPLTNELMAIMKKHKCRYSGMTKEWILKEDNLKLLNEFRTAFKRYRKKYVILDDYTQEDWEKHWEMIEKANA